MFDLSGKAALVTGASGGIGGAIARALHRQGATVTLSGTRAEALEALKAELGERTHVIAARMDDPAEIDRLAKEAEAAMGKLDILVNNAGITRDGLILRMSDEDWSDVLRINLTSAFVACRAATRAMMRGKFGRIVNIGSVSGIVGNAGQANYAAAKAGLAGLTKSIAREFASKGITANVVAPGFIETDMTEALGPAIKEAVLPGIPVKRFGRAEEIAAAVSFLASDDAGYITGQVVVVDGGMSM